MARRQDRMHQLTLECAQLLIAARGSSAGRSQGWGRTITSQWRRDAEMS